MSCDESIFQNRLNEAVLTNGLNMNNSINVNNKLNGLNNIESLNLAGQENFETLYLNFLNFPATEA